MFAAIKEWFGEADHTDTGAYADFERPVDVVLDGHFDIADLAKVLAEKCGKAAMQPIQACLDGRVIAEAVAAWSEREGYR